MKCIVVNLKLRDLILTSLPDVKDKPQKNALLNSEYLADIYVLKLNSVF
jgi:hypothetical protein